MSVPKKKKKTYLTIEVNARSSLELSSGMDGEGTKIIIIILVKFVVQVVFFSTRSPKELP